MGLPFYIDFVERNELSNHHHPPYILVGKVIIRMIFTRLILFRTFFFLIVGMVKQTHRHGSVVTC